MKSTDLIITKDSSPTYLTSLTKHDRAMVDSAVAEINLAQKLGNLETARQIGKIVVERFFGDDVEAFHSGHRKNVTYRALAEHEDLEPSYSSLWYAVAVYDHFQKIDKRIASALTLAHHRVLAHVRDPEVRAKLADSAVKEKLTAEQLQTNIRDSEPERDSGATKRGRPRLPEVVKGLAKAERALAPLVTEGRLDAMSGYHFDDAERAGLIAAAKLVSERALLLAVRLQGAPRA